MIIQIPGKTFLLGEYAVLQGGPALIATTKPYFQLKINSDNKVAMPFHADSPAGRFIHDHAFESTHLEWFSPYLQGGFGGSTAEFLACYYYQMKRTSPSLLLNQLNLTHLYQTYLLYAYNGIGIPPSGADLVAQTQSSIVYFEPQKILKTEENNRQKQETLSLINWPFSELSLLFFKTAYKLPTHQYLTSFQSPNDLPDFSDLSELTHQGYTALKEMNAHRFIESINDYAFTLQGLNLTVDSTKDLIKKLRKHSACFATKGCGALGADVIVAIVDSTQEKDFLMASKHYPLSLIATHRDL